MSAANLNTTKDKILYISALNSKIIAMDKDIEGILPNMAIKAPLVVPRYQLECNNMYQEIDVIFKNLNELLEGMKNNKTLTKEDKQFLETLSPVKIDSVSTSVLEKFLEFQFKYRILFMATEKPTKTKEIIVVEDLSLLRKQLETLQLLFDNINKIIKEGPKEQFDFSELEKVQVKCQSLLTSYNKAIDDFYNSDYNIGLYKKFLDGVFANKSKWEFGKKDFLNMFSANKADLPRPEPQRSPASSLDATVKDDSVKKDDTKNGPPPRLPEASI